MRDWVIAALAVQMLIVTPAGAQVATVALKSVQLSKVIEDDENAAEHTHVKVGTICLFAGAFNIVKQKAALPYTKAL